MGPVGVQVPWMEEIDHLLEWNRFLVASELGSGWGEDERNGKMFRHYLLHRTHSTALAEREKVEHSRLGSFFSFEQISKFTTSGGCIALWVRTPLGLTELVDGSEDLRAFTVAAELTNKFRLQTEQTISAQTQTDVSLMPAGLLDVGGGAAGQHQI